MERDRDASRRSYVADRRSAQIQKRPRVLCRLDSLIKIEKIINQYDYNRIYDGTVLKSFGSLNDNVLETGVTVIPKVPSLSNTFFVKTDDKVLDKEFRDGNYWYDNINEHFNNIICIKNQSLSGFTIKNVIIDLFKDRKRDKIVIGLTPGCDDDINSIMNVKQYYNAETGRQHFKIKDYYDPPKLTESFISVLSKASQHDIDILMGTEMLGSLEMCQTDELGFNDLFRNKRGESPFLTITPTVWSKGKNYLSVYLRNGEIVGTQYKQYSFEYTDDGERFEEDLIDTPREILLIHIPGWGRLVFPICVDFLVPTYRDLLVRELKATLMLCPSYSSGTVQFGNAAGSVRDFGTRFVWLNSCSALQGCKDKPDTIGLVSVPVMSPSCLEQSSIPIKPRCNGKCSKSCMFIITIQAISNDEKRCNEVTVEHLPL